MAGVTVPLGFPYPTGTDRVADGDNAMQALAESVDDFLAGATANVTLASHTGTWTVHRRGGLVWSRWEITIVGNPAAFATLATVPTGFRASLQFDFVAHNTATGAHLAMLATTAGLMSCRSPLTAGTVVAGSSCWAVAGGGALARRPTAEPRDDTDTTDLEPITEGNER